MKTAKEHYDSHLAAIYDWMAGGFETAAARQREFFRRAEIGNLPSGLAIDLGAGSGFQSIPLAEIGFKVLAIDFSADLLESLERRKGDLSIQTIEDDILNFSKYLPDEKARLIVCIGDTLTHLTSLDDVRKLLTNASSSLADDGVLMLTFRDYFSSELEGAQRFIPVRSDETRIFTCFLEYFENHVEVHDLLYTKEESGWKFSASAYPKLRLNFRTVVDELNHAGFSSVNDQIENGMVKIIAKKG